MPTCKCGKAVEDWRGARGHVQFTEGGDHGEKGEVPDGWRDLFDDGDSQEGEESEQEADGEAGGGEADPSPSETKESNSGQSDGSQSNGESRTFSDRLTTALTEDVRALWGGDK